MTLGDADARYWLGVDVGSTATKVVVIDAAGAMRARGRARTEGGFRGAALRARELALDQLGVSPSAVVFTVAAGYGRETIEFANDRRTEIAAQARGCYELFREPLTVIDIGGQDTKAISCDADGKRTNFKMNRKCAAGTGMFIEEVALRLGLDVGALPGLAESTQEEVTLGSFCTVFSVTEILNKLKSGTPVGALIRGSYRSVAKRVVELAEIHGQIVATGGVMAYHPLMRAMLAEELRRDVVVAPDPEFTAAFGAALLALELSAQG